MDWNISAKLIVLFNSRKMKPYYRHLNTIFNSNSEQYSYYSGLLNWVNSSQASIFQDERDILLKEIRSKMHSSYNNLKPWYYSLSRGCEICAAGKWSCLFISGVCNAKCFFCPAPQDQDDIPTSQMKSFNTSQEYVDYINMFGFKGVAFSGGEPLLNASKTIEYIKAIRIKCDPEIWIWVYTNGLSGTRDIYKKLHEAGVNEIRFNLCATNYNVDILKDAVPFIAKVTVEIPVVPEDFEKLKLLIPQLIKAGVSNLNIHELRLTQHNAALLSQRDYTYAHGHSPMVIESEIAALKLLLFAYTSKFEIGINYCNFPFKSNFQKVGYKEIIAQKYVKAEQEITANGYIRNITGSKGKVKLNQIEENDHLSIQYQSIVIKEVSSDSPKNDFIEIGGKPYSFELLNNGGEIKITTEEFLDALKVVAPEEITNNDIYRIYNFETKDSEFPDYM